jgi:hypothetical protein
VLIEKNLFGPALGMMQIFDVVTEGSQRTWPVVSRIAYVDPNPEHSDDLVRFAENVAITRGVNVRVFRTVRDAEQWMLSCLATDQDDARSKAAVSGVRPRPK